MEEVAENVRLRPRLYRYSIAVFLCGLSTLCRALIAARWGSNFPLITFYPAVLLSAWLGGLGPASVATVLCTLVALYLWSSPLYSFHVLNGGQVFGLCLFLAIGFLMSAIINVLDSTKRRLQDRTHELAQEVRQRSRSVERLRTVQNILDATLPLSGMQDL